MKRILTGAALIISITLLTRLGWIGFIVLVLAINLLSLREFYRLFQAANLAPQTLWGLVLSVGIIVSLVLVIVYRIDWKILLIIIPGGFGIFIRELFLKSPIPFHNLGITFLGIICITIPLFLFVAIAFLPFPEKIYHNGIILGYFFILWAGDSGAYLTGKSIGRHSLFKRISPSKTWEGSIGGLCCSLLVAFLNSFIFPGINLLNWTLIAIITAITGTGGDLVKSLMKRSLHIKDSGNILPGHGGMLDRFDTLLGSAPFVFCFLVLFVYE